VPTPESLEASGVLLFTPRVIRPGRVSKNSSDTMRERRPEAPLA
jgi:hypothetical protein